MLSLYDNFVSLSYNVYKKSTMENKTVFDLFTYGKVSCPILAIENIVVDKYKRGNRLGAKLIRELIDKNEDKVVIINLEYLDINKEELNLKEKIDRIIKLGKYFRNLGFVDINRYYGRYNNKISMCYNNEKYREFLVNKK